MNPSDHDSVEWTRETRVIDNYSKVPHGLWTAPLSYGAKCLLGWLHSHSPEYLARLTNGRIRSEFGCSAQALKWIDELVEAGFVRVSTTGARHRYHLLAEPWDRLAQRPSRTLSKNDSTVESLAEPVEKRQETCQKTTGNLSKNDNIEEHVVDQVADHLSLAHSVDSQSTAIATRSSESDDGFAQFWSMYPRKIGKPKCGQRWRRMTREQRAAALRALPDHLEHWRRNASDVRFVPHPLTWLNAERWTDELASDFEPEPERKEAPGMGAIRAVIERAQYIDAEVISDRAIGAGDA